MTKIEMNGVEIFHNGPPPYTYEKFSTGLGCILGSDGVNRLSFPGKPGATLLYNEEIEEVTNALNETSMGQQ